MSTLLEIQIQWNEWYRHTWIFLETESKIQWHYLLKCLCSSRSSKYLYLYLYHFPQCVRTFSKNKSGHRFGGNEKQEALWQCTLFRLMVKDASGRLHTYKAEVCSNHHPEKASSTLHWLVCIWVNLEWTRFSGGWIYGLKRTKICSGGTNLKFQI